MSDQRPSAPVDREDPEGLLNARIDSAGDVVGALGTEAGSDLNSVMLLRARAPARTEGWSR